MKHLRAVLLVATILLTLLYSWLFAHELEPELLSPDRLVARVEWLEQGHLQDWSDVRLTHAVDVARIAANLWDLEPGFAATMAFNPPPVLVIDADQSSTYVISDTKIQISVAYAAARGQLARALIQSWLLSQGGSGLAASSLLRLETTSDSLASMLLGRTDFELENSTEVELPQIRNWLDFAQSAQSYCQSNWRSLHLGRNSPLCSGHDGVTELSFRPLIDAMIWSVFSEVPNLDRLDFIREWATKLRETAAADSQPAPPAEKTLQQMKESLVNEFDTLFARRLSPKYQADGLMALQLAHLGVEQEPELGLGFIKNRVNALYGQPGAFRLGDSGGLSGRLAQADPRGVAIRLGTLVWQSCEPVTVEQIRSIRIESRKILYIENCGELSQATWQRLNRFGVEAFADLEPNVSFMILSRAGLDLAIRRGQFDLRAPLHKYMTTRPPRGASLLGLESAAKSGANSHRVLGAIEAVESFRAPVAPSAL